MIHSDMTHAHDTYYFKYSMNTQFYVQVNNEETYTVNPEGAVFSKMMNSQSTRTKVLKNTYNSLKKETVDRACKDTTV